MTRRISSIPLAVALPVLLFLSLFLSVFAGALTGKAQVAKQQDATDLSDFTKNMQDYVALQKKLAAALDVKLTQTSSQAEIAAHEKALGAVIRQARLTAKRGDIFGERAAQVFKTVIAADFKQRTGQKKRLEEDEVPEFTPVINQTYPATAALATFPATLLAALPKHPEELEYRLVSNHLVLRDIEANIIVDYVPNVVPLIP